jgi:preprotein translocase subunit SecA
MFEMMVEEIREETVRYCYGVTVNTRTERKQVIVGGEGHKDEYHDDAAGAAQGAQPQGNMPAQAPKEQKVQKPVTVKREEPKVGRNDPCPCGSGKKYKACCGK